MSTHYYTVAGAGCTEIEITKSRFITYVERVESEAAAIQFVEQIKKKHWDATHNCTAYVIGQHEQWQRADDDGEPSGTAGRPMLEVLKKASVKDTVLVVTRYFGGIKLGAGGLVRAYSKAAACGLRAVGLVERKLCTPLTIEIDYDLQGIVENQMRTQHYPIVEKEFYEKVKLHTYVACGAESTLLTAAADWTAGRAVYRTLDPLYIDVPVAPPSVEEE